jgi:hypothetical protein
LNRPDFVYLEAPRGGDIAEKRDAQAESALEQKCTHIWYADADMVYPPNTLIDLFKIMTKTDADLVSGLCFRGYPPYSPLIWAKEGPLMEPFKDFKFGQIVEAGAVGCGCLLVKCRVFRSLKRPWFRIEREETIKDGKLYTIRRGEDVYFTRSATNNGFKLVVYTDYDIGHMRELQIERHFWLVFSILSAMPDWGHLAQLFKKLHDKKWVRRHLFSKQPEII